jgi:hypothetical protein
MGPNSSDAPMDDANGRFSRALDARALAGLSVEAVAGSDGSGRAVLAARMEGRDGRNERRENDSGYLDGLT